MKLNNCHLFFDFDSTFNQVEALDTLIEITIADVQERKEVLLEIGRITDLGMAGKLDYMSSLQQRLNLLQATKSDVEQLSKQLYNTISTSILNHQSFFIENKEHISIISNGFKDFIVPVVEQFGLLPKQVYANRFIYDRNETIVGIDENNPLSKEAGKPKVIQRLNIPETIIMIGDGYNDYQVKKHEACNLFVLYTENIKRKAVVPFADEIVNNFDELLNLLKRNEAIILSEA